jgi:hypothetical protein
MMARAPFDDAAFDWQALLLPALEAAVSVERYPQARALIEDATFGVIFFIAQQVLCDLRHQLSHDVKSARGSSPPFGITFLNQCHAWVYGRGFVLVSMISQKVRTPHANLSIIGF